MVLGRDATVILFYIQKAEAKVLVFRWDLKIIVTWNWSYIKKKVSKYYSLLKANKEGRLLDL